MNRIEFLKRLGIGGLGIAAATTGLSTDFIEKNIVVKKDIQYVELPHLPGTRFVFSSPNEYNTEYGIIGHTEVILDEVKKYWNKGLYYKNPKGEFIPYEEEIMPLITNSTIKELNNTIPQVHS